MKVISSHCDHFWNTRHKIPRFLLNCTLHQYTNSSTRHHLYPMKMSSLRSQFYLLVVPSYDLNLISSSSTCGHVWSIKIDTAIQNCKCISKMISKYHKSQKISLTFSSESEIEIKLQFLWTCQLILTILYSTAFFIS